MKKIVFLLVVLVLAGCSLGNPLEPTEDPYTIKVDSPYDADFAAEVCGDRPVDSFNPDTGEVECARWEPTAAADGDESEEAEEVSDPELGDFSPDINAAPMQAYQGNLEYEVPSELRVPNDLLEGFEPVPSLVMNPDDLELPAIPGNLDPYIGFVDESGIWGDPVAGYNDGNNWSCEDVTGWCADDIQALNWRVITGYEVCHPAVGCLKDPDGGAVMILFNNFHDSDEVWSVRNDSGIYVDAGFVGYGPFWNHNRETNDVEADIAAIRNHFLFQLAYPHPDNHLEGQCGSSDLCETVTYVVIYRMWDVPEIGIDYSHFQLISWGQWVRP